MAICQLQLLGREVKQLGLRAKMLFSSAVL